jgi:hypothetical protein
MGVRGFRRKYFRRNIFRHNKIDIMILTEVLFCRVYFDANNFGVFDAFDAISKLNSSIVQKSVIQK